MITPGIAFDLVAAIVVAACAWSGWRRGLIVSAFDVVVLGTVLLLGVQLLDTPGILGANPVGLAPATAAGIGFLVCAIVGDGVRAFVSRALVSGRRVALADHAAIDYAEHVAGAVPGVVRGGIYIAILGVLVAQLSLSPAEGSSVELTRGLDLAARAVGDSTIAGLIEPLTGGVGTTVSSLSESGAVLSPNDVAALSPGTRSTEDRAAEDQLLRMVNLAREQAGSSPLTMEPGLTAVALRHSDEMLRLGYFAHVSPSGEDPGARYAEAQVSYSRLGENLAYAPSVVAAYNGLFASAPHRQNLLSSDFRRIGIGVARTDRSWIMVTQDFAD